MCNLLTRTTTRPNNVVDLRWSAQYPHATMKQFLQVTYRFHIVIVRMAMGV